MGFRNPFRIQVDSNDVAYVTDYSPDSTRRGAFAGPAGTGRVEIVRKPTNYGWPLCMSRTLPMFQWDFNTSTPLGAATGAVGLRQPGRGPQHLALEHGRRRR